METTKISRRTFIRAGLATGFMALVPVEGLSFTLLSDDLEPIGPNALDNVPYNDSYTGTLLPEESFLIVQFAYWAISAWEFKKMENYQDMLLDTLNLKTIKTPSYLAEYQSAARLIRDVQNRFDSEQETFLYLMFTRRNEKEKLKTRLGRAQNFVFDELVRHIVSNGGFRRFGLVNYSGYANLPFTDPDSYRRRAYD